MAFDLPVGLHFLSNSKNQIISTVIYKVRETVFLEKKKKFADVFSSFMKKTNRDFYGSKASTISNATNTKG